MPQKRDFCSRCSCCSCFRVCRFLVLAETDLSHCCPLLPAPFIPVVSPSIEDNTSPTFSLKLVEFMNKLQNGNILIFFNANAVFPLCGAGASQAGTLPAMGWAVGWQGRGMESTRPPPGRSNLSAHEDEVQLGWDTGSSTLWVWKKGFLFPVPFSGGNLLNW